MPGPTLVTSTAQLTPKGVLGYAKGIAVVVGVALAALVEVVGADWEYAAWLQLGILVCTAIATIVTPNPVEPVTVVDAGAS